MKTLAVRQQKIDAANESVAPEVKAYIDEIMGKFAGDGVSPMAASLMVADRFGVCLSPRQTMNVWIGGEADY